MAEWGVSPRMFGGGLLLTLSDLGLVPKVDVIRLERFDSVWPAADPRPVWLERVTLQDVFRSRGGGSDGGGGDGEGGGLLRRFVQPALLQDPTFAELLVVFRRRPQHGNEVTRAWGRAVARARSTVRRMRGDDAEPPQLVAAHSATGTARRREPISLRVLTGIPMAYWKAVFPDKLLQFKPLDGLRLDLITVIGAAAVIAQVKFESPLLEVVSLVSVAVAVVRSVLGYRRMSVRYENFVNEMIAQKTLAQEGAALEALAAAAAAQRFACAALAYAALIRRGAAARRAVVAAAAGGAVPTALPLWLRRLLGPLGALRVVAGNRSLQRGAHDREEGKDAQGQVELHCAAADGGDDGPSYAGMPPSEIARDMERLLSTDAAQHVKFDVRSALEDLSRLGLIAVEGAPLAEWLRDAGLHGRGAAAPASPVVSQHRPVVAHQDTPMTTAWPGVEEVLERDLPLLPVLHGDADAALKAKWAELLEESVSTSLAAIV